MPWARRRDIPHRSGGHVVRRYLHHRGLAYLGPCAQFAVKSMLTVLSMYHYSLPYLGLPRVADMHQGVLSRLPSTYHHHSNAPVDGAGVLVVSRWWRLLIC